MELFKCSVSCVRCSSVWRGSLHFFRDLISIHREKLMISPSWSFVLQVLQILLLLILLMCAFLSSLFFLEIHSFYLFKEHTFTVLLLLTSLNFAPYYSLFLPTLGRFVLLLLESWGGSLSHWFGIFSFLLFYMML